MITNGTSAEENPYDELRAILAARNTAEFITETTVYVIINLMALLGNILVCFIFYKNPNLRSVTYLYIFALAISDVFMAAFCMPLVWGVLLVGEWRYGGGSVWISWLCCAFLGIRVTADHSVASL